MLGSTIAFLASPAGGALVGAVQNWLADKRQDKKDKQRRRHEREMGQLEHSAKMYQASIEAAQIKPLRYVKEKRQTRLKWFLFGEPFECVTRVEKDKLSQTPRERLSGLIVACFGITYCVISLWVGFWFMADVSVVPPDSKQAGIDLLFFKLHFGGNKPVPQAVLGPLLYMLSLPGFIMTHWIIRRKPNK